MKRELRVGVLFLFAIAILGYMVSRLTPEQSLFTESRTYYALVDDSTGLLLGAAVRVAGIDVGRLKEKGLQDNQAKLVMEIVSDQVIHADAVITLKSLGYLGDRYLDLDPGSRNAPVLRERSIIPAEEGATLEGLMDKSTALLESWTATANRLKGLLGG